MYVAMFMGHKQTIKQKRFSTSQKQKNIPRTGSYRYSQTNYNIFKIFCLMEYRWIHLFSLNIKSYFQSLLRQRHSQSFESGRDTKIFTKLVDKLDLETQVKRIVIIQFFYQCSVDLKETELGKYNSDTAHAQLNGFKAKTTINNFDDHFCIN